MEISESYALELARQAVRKTELRTDIEADLVGIDRILFEAGCGHGHWLTNYAETYPEQTCVGVDLISWRIRKCLDKRNKRQLSQLHFYKAELSEFLEVLPARIRFERTVLLFPDPWPKARHHRRRMVQNGFLDEVARRTDQGGTFCFRSDDLPYYDWTVEHLRAHPEWVIDETQVWPHEKKTYFEGLMDKYYSVIARRV
jgi:tRNA (guanine-N7-)-methyltransferase